MTIDEAIKIISSIARGVQTTANPDTIHALQLGIEALKLTQYLRKGLVISNTLTLPGETT